MARRWHNLVLVATVQVACFQPVVLGRDDAGHFDAGPGDGGAAGCTLGQDWSCNDDPSVSTIWGQCGNDGRCSCLAGFTINTSTGKCVPTAIVDGGCQLSPWDAGVAACPVDDFAQLEHHSCSRAGERCRNTSCTDVCSASCFEAVCEASTCQWGSAPAPRTATPQCADAGSPCGASRCGASEICVHQCCGGQLPPCVDRNDAGMCDFGLCQGLGGQGNLPCAAPPCTPPPPFCVPLPSGCNPTISCGCFSSDPCWPIGSCGEVEASGVACRCA